MCHINIWSLYWSNASKLMFELQEETKFYLKKRRQFVCKIREYLITFKFPSVGKGKFIMYKAASYFTMCWLDCHFRELNNIQLIVC